MGEMVVWTAERLSLSIGRKMPCLARVTMVWRGGEGGGGGGGVGSGGGDTGAGEGARAGEGGAGEAGRGGACWAGDAPCWAGVGWVAVSSSRKSSESDGWSLFA
jgi:hypothetical protein